MPGQRPSPAVAIAAAPKADEPVNPRLSAAAAQIKEIPALQAGEILLLPAFFAWTPLPLRETSACYAERQNGPDRMIFAMTGPEPNLPYGVYARHLLAWLITCCAVRKVDTIYLDQDMGVFWRAFASNENDCRPGGKRRLLIGDQARRLALMAMRSHSLKKTFGQSQIEKYSATSLFKDTVIERNNRTGKSKVLEMRCIYHDGLFMEFPLFPVDRRAWSALASTPLALDIYAWASHKNAVMRKRETRIPWNALVRQFSDCFCYGPGQEFEQPSRSAKSMFPARFMEMLRRVRVVYPELIVRADKSGITFYKTSPHVAPSPVNKSIRLRRQKTNRFIESGDPAQGLTKMLS